MIGTTVGSYRVTEKVSVGGMGTVYRAEHTLIGKPAAVKVLHPELRNNPEAVQRFLNEAKATTQIKHPGIVEIFDFGYLESGDGYIVMEFLEGMSLATRLETRGKMAEGEAAMLMRSVCSALAAAHAKGIIHRDLKPDNVFLCPDPDAPTGERPKLLDFGIAKLSAVLQGLGGPTSATKTGAVIGTPMYMSPEQCRGTGELDERSDLYSIGCMFYEMVAGRPPFANMTAGELIGAHLFIDPVSPKSVGAPISDAADALIMQLLAKEPAKRVQTANELARRFAELARGQGIATPVPTLDEISRPVARPSAESVAPTLPSDPGLSSSPRISAPADAIAPADSQPVRVTSQPTTLSGAASQSIRTPRSRAPMVAGLAAAFLVAAGGAFFIVSSQSKPSASTSAQPSERTPEPDTTPPDPAPAAVPDPAPVSAKTPPPAPDSDAPAEPPETASSEPVSAELPPPAPTTPTKAVAKSPKQKSKRPTSADKSNRTDKTTANDKSKSDDKSKPTPTPGILIETDL